jgi:hypothetical protein
MRKTLVSLFVVTLAGCSASAPEAAVLAVALKVPQNPHLADCVSIDAHDPSSNFIGSMRLNGRNVFPASQCHKSGWDVLTPRGGQAQYVAYGRFLRTSPWTARLYIRAFSNGMHSDHYWYSLKLVHGTWVATSEHAVSSA